MIIFSNKINESSEIKIYVGRWKLVVVYKMFLCFRVINKKMK